MESNDTLPQPYYEEPGITIYHGDCVEIMPRLAQFDLVFTSPPYNLGGTPWPHLGHWKSGGIPGGKSKWKNGADGSGAGYSSHVDSMPYEAYMLWQKSVLLHCWDRLTPTGAIYYNHKPRVIGERLWVPLELNPDLPLRQIIIWKRAGGINFNLTAYVPTHEWIMVLAQPKFRLKTRSASGAGDVWSINQERYNAHPAPFPQALPARAIETTGALSVLDPFLGSGTTLIAAKDFGISGVGIDIDERYCEMAAKRLQAKASINRHQ